MEVFISVSLTSPNLFPSPLRKHAQTCHLHCSASLTCSNDICSQHNGLKESPDLRVGGQVTSYTPIGYKAVDMTTRHLPTSDPGRPRLFHVKPSPARMRTKHRERCKQLHRAAGLFTGQHLCKFKLLVVFTFFLNLTPPQ